jgi:hypothetical protein
MLTGQSSALDGTLVELLESEPCDPTGTRLFEGYQKRGIGKRSVG